MITNPLQTVTKSTEVKNGVSNPVVFGPLSSDLSQHDHDAPDFGNRGSIFDFDGTNECYFL